MNGGGAPPGGIRLSLPHHYLAAAAAPHLEPDYDIYADLPKPTKNSVSVTVTLFFSNSVSIFDPIWMGQMLNENSGCLFCDVTK